MSLKTMKKEDLELLSYTDLTQMILTENKKPMNTPAIFRKICDLLELTDSDYTNKIGDFYTSLTTDKRFLLLDSAEWDLKDRHVVAVIVADDDDDDSIDSIDEDEEEIEEEIDDKEEDIDIVNEDDDLEDDDDLDDLVIIDEDELEVED
jgi:DNA-directed RNA polymerase, delta subunit